MPEMRLQLRAYLRISQNQSIDEVLTNTAHPRLNIVERQAPEIYLLRDFDKAEIKDETLTAQFKSRQKATIRLQFYSPALLQEVKNYIEEAAKCCR
jgi:hypothetical protein